MLLLYLANQVVDSVRHALWQASCVRGRCGILLQSFARCGCRLLRQVCHEAIDTRRRRRGSCCCCCRWLWWWWRWLSTSCSCSSANTSTSTCACTHSPRGGSSIIKGGIYTVILLMLASCKERTSCDISLAGVGAHSVLCVRVVFMWEEEEGGRMLLLPWLFALECCGCSPSWFA